MGLHVVLDTTVVRSSKRRLLEGPDFLVLKKAVNSFGVAVHVSRVVIREAERQFREDAEKKFEKLRNAYRDLESFVTIPSGIAAPVFDLDSACRDYSVRLLERLSELKAHVIEVPDTGLEEMLDRVLSTRKPFNRKGKGLQDATIWRAILDEVAVKDAGQTIFITNNNNDFCGAESKELHSNLRDDLVARGLPPDSVSILPDVAQFNEKFVLPRLKKLEEIKRAIEEHGGFAHFSLMAFWHDKFDDILQEIRGELGRIEDQVGRAIDGQPEVSEPWIDMLGDPERISVDDVSEIDRDTIVIHVDFQVEVTIEFYMLNADYYALDDDSPIHVSEHDWNDHGKMVQVTMQLDVMMVLTVNPTEGEVCEWAVIQVVPLPLGPQ